MLDEHLPTTMADLATAHPDVVVFACTSAGALRGNAHEAELIKRIAGVTGATTFSVATTVRAAIASRGAERVGVITPYVESLNERIRQSLEADGFEVVAIRGLGIDENFAIADADADRIVDFARQCFADTEIDVLFASCTNFRALDARERIEEVLDVPVVTSNQAALEAVFAHLDIASVP